MKTKKQSTKYSAKSEVTQFRTKKSFSHVAKRELKKAPFTAWLGMIITSLYILVAVFAPLIAPYGESEVFPIPFAPWSEEFLLGTDQIGRDILTRLIYGARNTIGIAFVTFATKEDAKIVSRDHRLGNCACLYWAWSFLPNSVVRSICCCGNPQPSSR